MAAVSEAETNDDSETLTHLSEKTPRNRDPEEDRHTHTQSVREKETETRGNRRRKREFINEYRVSHLQDVKYTCNLFHDNANTTLLNCVDLQMIKMVNFIMVFLPQ